jgi:uncharacterized protein YhaN
MGIRIDEINIKSLGPIADLQLKLGTINLIYGKNESGKTHLVEFLIHSLFKNKSFPGMRSLPSTGQVSVMGLADSITPFSPSSKTKLDEFLKTNEKTIATNISRLLVVRAGELSLTDQLHVGINRSILEEYLSNTGLINNIRDKIQTTVQKASITNGMIQGSRTGWLKEHYSRKEELHAIDLLMEKVNEDYSTGRRAAIQVELNEALEQFAAMNKAKQHLAYDLNQQIGALEKELEKISISRLQQMGRDLDEYRTKVEAFKKLEDNYQAKMTGSADFPWLKAAMEEYQALTSQEAHLMKTWPLIIAGMFLAGAVLLILFGQTYPAVGATIIGAVLGYFYINQLRKVSLQAAQNAELDRIATEFHEKFGRLLTDLPTLRLVHDEQQENSIAAREIAKQIEDLKKEIEQLEQSIADNARELTGSRVPKEAWADTEQEISRRVQGMQEQLRQLNVRFAAVGIAEKDFLSQPVNIVFDETRHKTLEQQIANLKSELSSEDERLNSLRARLSQETHQDISTTWEILIQKLQDKRIQTAKEYQNITAKVLAGMVVNSALDELYKEEEKSIHEGLRSCNVTDYLKKMTTHYNRIEFNNGTIRVADPYAEFSFSELSTATQEQILLALRLGFSSRCFFDQSMFLVLDDAFQHSDWKRREALVDGVFEIAKQDWQIIYLTMDDNIRDLFCQKAERIFPGEFKYFELRCDLG